MRLAFLLLLCVAPTASADIYKCQAAGKTVFSDQPCQPGAKTITAKPASGTVPTATAQAEDSKAKARDIDARIKRKIIDAEIDRELQHLEAIERERDAELDRLRDKKSLARNNLAGATWEQSISNEMIAVTNKYDSRIRTQQSKLEELKARRNASK